VTEIRRSRSGRRNVSSASTTGTVAPMSEVIPEDEDRGGHGALEPDDGAPGEHQGDDDEQGGTGSDDGGPGSLNM
jgi:hypothetical protein